MSSLDDQLNDGGMPLDGATLDGLRELGGDEFLAELAALFIADAPAHLASIDEALAAGDSERMARSAHALKSSAANMGAKRLQAILSAIERAGREKDLQDAPARVIDLKDEYVRVAHALEALQQR